ncbi:hypothetical protein KS4_16070 [Poriferisphaera corsica]|uniref:Uncharacterized protein n=1 Tax=Poriferisphaera corsica TaxID=2528020 RepID=A0A517YTJ9_9BACT|nr:ATP-binding protein [Poriferisphaera corsica]QDU33556.1 hypothetical protein KS4_16070 [Poriferisphaera corsica]
MTSSFDEFEKVFWANHGLAVVVDEAMNIFDGETALRAKRMLTEGRHQAHVVHLVAQRAVDQLNATARQQADTAFIFRIAEADAKSLAGQFGIPALAQAHLLPQYHYFAVGPCGYCKLGETTP